MSSRHCRPISADLTVDPLCIRISLSSRVMFSLPLSLLLLLPVGFSTSLTVGQLFAIFRWRYINNINVTIYH